MNSSFCSLAGELLLEPNVTAVTCSRGPGEGGGGWQSRAFVGQVLVLLYLRPRIRGPCPGEATKLTPASPTSWGSNLQKPPEEGR